MASRQSRPLKDRAELQAEVAKIAAEVGDGAVPRPDRWSGFRVTPLEIEFWHDGAHRLHDRLVYRRASPDAAWSISRLFP